MKLTFLGGVCLPQNKNTANSEIEKLPLPAKVYISLAQAGLMCSPRVKIGDIVDKGQVIADDVSGNGCPVHSSVSGTVENVETGDYGHIVIVNDFEERLSKNITPIDKTITELTLDNVIDICRKAGIVGIGGDTVPVYEKLSVCRDNIKCIIADGTECETYLNANRCVLTEQTDKVLNGLKILAKVLNTDKAYIAVDDRHRGIAKDIEKKTETSSLFKVGVLKAKYPQSDERMLVCSLASKSLGAELEPYKEGYLVLNAETVTKIFDAVVYGMPHIEETVSVGGDCVRENKVLSVRLGTPVTDLIDYCGGLMREPKKVIFGSSMRGRAQDRIDAPTVKGTNAVVVLSRKNIIDYDRMGNCIRCGRCFEHCPMRLMPNRLYALAEKGKVDKCKKYNILDCNECGICSYVCPASIPLAQKIRDAKTVIVAGAEERFQTEEMEGE